MVTTLDSTLQETAYQALGNYDGAVVVMEPSTGKVLAMVSKPDFDPNTIAADWDSIISEDNNNSVLLNRATQGLYPPGSTFKIITTLEYIREIRIMRITVIAVTEVLQRMILQYTVIIMPCMERRI